LRWQEGRRKGSFYFFEFNMSMFRVNTSFFTSKFVKDFPKKSSESKLNYITQKRGFFGKFKVDCFIEDSLKTITFHLRDYYGLSVEGFATLLIKAGIKNPFKNSLDEHKSCMEKYLTPLLIKNFVMYSSADVFYLSYINLYFCKGMNEIMDKLGFPSKYYFDKIPTTVGSISSHFLESFIRNSFETYKDDKGQVINLLPDFDKLNVQMGHSPFYKKGKRKSKKNLVSTLINAASIRTIATNYSSNSGLLNVLTAGGRAFNERYHEYQAEHVLDIDFKSCYGSSLNMFDYPLGVPVIHAVSDDNETKLTLGEFLSKYEDELVENFYTITISGKLSFRQNFLYSKRINQKGLEKRINQVIFESEDDDFSIDKNDTAAEMVILEKQLINTVITSDTLNILRNICTNQELNEIFNCEVETALFYRKSDYVTDLKTFISLFQQELSFPENKRSYNEEGQCVFDKRPRIWTSLKLSSFINPLINLRNEYKKMEKQAKLNSDIQKSEEYQSKQILIKTIVNSVYGVVTSSHFDVCNVNLSKNITTMARNHIFLTTRTLYGFQSITDGTTFSPYSLFKFSGIRKPGLATLSNFEKLKSHRSVKKISLPIDWSRISENIFEVENLIKKHVDDFYNYYKLSLPYGLELKPEHIAEKFVFLKKADYAIIKNSNEIIIKSRGVSRKISKEETPIFQIVENVLYGKPIRTLTHKETRIITMVDYFQSISRNNKLIKLAIQPEDLKIPGYSVEEEKHFHFNVSDLPYLDEAHYKWKDRFKEKFSYDHLLLSHPFKDVFKLRINDHHKLIKKFEKNGFYYSLCYRSSIIKDSTKL
jgi:DNA polymerase family B